MTLLFAFFAMMYAISSVDARKLVQVSHALQVAFDDSARGQSIGRGHGVLPERGPRIVAPSVEEAGVSARVARDLAPEIQAHRIELTIERRGLVLSIPEAGSFAVGSDELSPMAEALIARVAAALDAAPNPIRVEGHTDDVPIHTLRFRSNWDLSTARATRVVEWLSTRAGITPDRLSAAGYGQFHPRVPNDSSAARARNRRIDIVVLNDLTRAGEEAPSKDGQ